MPDIVPSASSSSKAVKPKEQFIGTTSSASAGSASKQKKGLKPAASKSVQSRDDKKARRHQQEDDKGKKSTKNYRPPPAPRLDETKSKVKVQPSSQPNKNSPAPRLPTTKPLLPPCLEELRTTKNHLQPVDADRIDDPNLKLDAAGVPVVLKSLRETRSNDKNHNQGRSSNICGTSSADNSSTANKFLSAKQRRHLTVLSKNLGPLDHDRRRLIKQWTAVLFPLVEVDEGNIKKQNDSHAQQATSTLLTTASSDVKNAAGGGQRQ
ncbi:unnamed protein product, partial [Amoebophrya sp. A120]|eukprot:GSA120T00004608001.1